MQPYAGKAVLQGMVLFLASWGLTEGVLWAARYPAWWSLAVSESADPAMAPHERAGWIHRAGTYELDEGTRRFTQVFVSNGVRRTAPEGVEPTAASGSLLLLGDSFVEGYGLADEQTFAWKLQAARPDLRIYNLGTAGYGSLHVLGRLEELSGSEAALGRPLTGTVWVLHLLSEFNEERNVGAVHSLRVYHENRLREGWRLPFAWYDESRGLVVDFSPGELVWPVSRYSRSAALIEDSMKSAGRWSRLASKRKTTLEILRRIVSVSRDRGWSPIIGWMEGTAESAAEYEEFLSDLGVTFLDLKLRSFHDPSYRLADGHPNEKLAAVIADRLAACCR